MNKLKALAKGLVPWLLAGVIIASLFHQSPPQLVWSMVWKADWGVFFFLSLAYFVAAYTLDSLTLRASLRAARVDIPARALLHSRAESYYYAVVNYNVGQGLLAYLLQKKSALSLRNAMSLIFAIMLIDFFSLLISASLGLSLYPFDGGFKREISLTVWIAILATLLFFFIARLLPTRFPRLSEKLGMLTELSWRTLLKIFAYRGLYVAGVILGLYIPLFPFHLDISLTYFIAAAPLVLIVGALPITPSGLGTTQAAFLYLFMPYAQSDLLLPGESPRNLLLALILAWTFLNLLWKLLTGIACKKLRPSA